jgi:hypothetical protein
VAARGRDERRTGHEIQRRVTTVYFSPTQSAGVKRGNWIQTVPGKGWWVVLRLYSPLEPFFDKTWRPSEITLVQ